MTTRFGFPFLPAFEAEFTCHALCAELHVADLATPYLSVATHHITIMAFGHILLRVETAIRARGIKIPAAVCAAIARDKSLIIIFLKTTLLTVQADAGRVFTKHHGAATRYTSC